MLRNKLIGTASAAVLVATLGMVPAATAAPGANAAPNAVAAAQPVATTLPVDGTTTDALGNVTAFTGQISDLTARTVGGVLTLTGTLTGTGLPAGGTAFTTEITDLAADQACTILDLTLGPINLDLLGLVIDLNQVELDITAVPGAGNLLGNLLCAIAGLLDGGGPLQGIGALLNRLLTGLGL
jgi:hypothetical protein